MNRYICKCGKVIYKSTNAENTGNRDTAGCEGCPYLLPWGSNEYVEGQGFVKDIQGYECRMSPSIDYASTYYGSADDKCTLRIISLDLDFLEEIQAWITENADNQLSGRFSRNTIRGTDYSNKGRYSWSISCAQNKKGMAAKAALIQRFFDSDRHRLDMTPEQEKERILAIIEKSKKDAQGKEKEMQYTIGENLNNDCLYAYAAGKFWVYDQRVKRWFISDFCQSEYEKAKLEESLNLSPEAFLSRDDLGYWGLDDYEVPTAALDALKQAIKSKNPEKAPSEVEEDLPEVCENCLCSTCGNDECTSPCWMNEKEAICRVAGAAGEGCEYYISKEETPCEKEMTPNQPPREVEQVELSAQSPSVPACPADAGAATQSLSAAEPASLAADAAQAFDYSGLDKKTASTLHAAERLIFEARRDYVTGLAQAVHIAHEALCGGVVQNLDNSKHGNRGDDAFASWCASVGLKRSTAYNLLQVNALLSGATPEEQATLEAASPSLLYAAAKPSAPAELVQAVKDGDITTHKQFKELEARLKATEQKLAEERQAHQAEQKATSALLAEEQRRRQQANEERIAAQDQAQRHKEMKDAAIETLKGEREAAAQKIKRQAEIIAMREKELAEESDRADAAEQRVAEMANRPMEVAVQVADSEKFESMVNERVAEKTAMYEAQMRFLKEQANDAELRAQSNQNSTYMIAADFAERMAVAVHGIRTTFWNMAKSLSDEDFASALEPLDEAVARIYNREWEDEQYLEDEDDAN